VTFSVGNSFWKRPREFAPSAVGRWKKYGVQYSGHTKLARFCPVYADERRKVSGDEEGIGKFNVWNVCDPRSAESSKFANETLSLERN